MTMYEPDWTVSSLEHFQGAEGTGPGLFNSIGEARQRLTALLLRMMELKRWETRHSASRHVLKIEDLLPKRRSILEGLDQWWTTFETLLDVRRRQQRLTEEDIRAAQLLQVQQLSAYIHLSVTALDEETKYDTYLPEFQRIVSLCRALLARLDGSLSDEPPRTKKFVYEHGVIPSLYLTGYKCRDPVVRREAHRQLASIRRKEGVWDSDLMAEVVRHAIDVEEMESNRVVVGSPSDIPNEARVWREFVDAGPEVKLPKVLFELRLDSSGATRIVERNLV